MLFSTWDTRIAVIPSALLGIPGIAYFAIISKAINELARGLLEESYDPMDDLAIDAVWVFILALAQAICKFFDSFFWLRAGSAISVQIRKNLFAKMMQSEVTFFDVNPVGGILSLLSEDARFVQSAFGPVKGIQIQNLSGFLFAIIITFVYSWRIGLIYFGSLVAILLVAPLFLPGMDRHSKLKAEKVADTITIAEEAISSIRTVRGFNREDREIERFGESNRLAQHHERMVSIIMTSLIALMMTIVWGSIIALFYYGVTLVESHTFEIGDLLACFGFQMMGDFLLIAVMSSFSEEAKAIAAGARILKLTQHEPQIPFEGGIVLDEFFGHIQFMHVSFKYPTREAYVLKDVTFEVLSGQVAALVGHSGSGKSTCVQLIERFYDPSDGLILVDGCDITTLDPRWLHQKIALVAQEPVLFSGTIKENVLYGCRDASDEMIWRALETARARKFVQKFPKRENELVGEKGTSLSGGQRQRIAIARAIVKNPVVLITDEATSALDAKSEKKVQIALDQVMAGRTAIVVAHRLSTIRNAKIIYVFDAGEIKEQGTHEQLVGLGGCYFNLVHKQLSRDELASVTRKESDLVSAATESSSREELAAVTRKEPDSGSDGTESSSSESS
jgi:ABC-type multidrug transport system fused ATPase/permease subunit